MFVLFNHKRENSVMVIRRNIALIIVLTLLLFAAFWGSFFSSKNSDSNYSPKYSATTINKSQIYILGVHPLHNPIRLFEVYQPLVDYLNKNLKNCEIKLRASRNYNAFDERLFNAEFHFALPNPYQTVEATKHGYTIFGKMGDDFNFKGIILIRKDSNIKNVMDLKGKIVSYPAPTALAATMMPQWLLYKNGLNVMTDIENIYVGSQESSIMNVYLGKSIASATWPPPWLAFKKQRPKVAKDLIVKWETETLPNNGLVARNDVPKDVVTNVGKLIFNLHTHEEGRKILERMELSKYEPANDLTYQSVRDFLIKFEKEVRPIRISNE